MNSITIHYCRQCNWMLRSTWMAQELLSTFAEELDELRLRPGTGGIFEIHANEALIRERKRDGGFPDVKTLKRLVRDTLFPDRQLGHLESQEQQGDKS